MIYFINKLSGTLHFYGIEVWFLLFNLLTGKKNWVVRKFNGKTIVFITGTQGSLTTNRRTGGSPALAIPTFFGGIVYAEVGTPDGVVLHEVGHIVEPAAQVRRLVFNPGYASR
jgi:hypothetical protein